jgi:trigger factor
VSVKREQPNVTTTKLTISADQALLSEVKNETLKRLGKQIRVSGFRPGKAPIGLVEKNVDSSLLQTEFLDVAINRLYSKALENEKVRPVSQPKVTVLKFVPFTTLEFMAEVESIGAVTLPDYTKIRLNKKTVKVLDKEIDEVIDNLQSRQADKVEVKRAAKEGDEVTLRFSGTDSKTHQPVKGADGDNYPLMLGSNTFIPGFEPNLIGLKAGSNKTFNLTFPKNYGVAALQNRQVTFDVTISKVHELTKPKTDDAFAAKAGPFKTLEALKADIRMQLLTEKQTEAERDFENELLSKIADDSQVAIPTVLVDEEVERTEQEVRQNLSYRGQTWAEFLAELGKSEEEYRDSLKLPAERRVRTGLVLTEIADREHITVTPEEFEIRLQLLKGQYKDPSIQTELDKPENKRSILSRLLSEKTIARLSQFATSK